MICTSITGFQLTFLPFLSADPVTPLTQSTPLYHRLAFQEDNILYVYYIVYWTITTWYSYIQIIRNSKSQVNLTMVKIMKMPLEISFHLWYLHQDKGVKICELGKQFKDYSKFNIYLQAKKPMHTVQSDRLSENKGWPRLLTERYKRNLIQGIHMLRRSIQSFSIQRLNLEAGIDKQISDYTVRRLLNRKGYNYRQSRKKGLLSQKDLRLRLQFARKVKRLFPDTI